MSWKFRQLFWNSQRATLWLLIALNLLTIAMAGSGGAKKGTASPTTKKITTTTTAAPSSTTEAGSTSPAIPEICIEGIRAHDSDNEDHTSNGDSSLVQVIEGDVMVSVMTSDPLSAMFIINRINQAKLFDGDFEMGIRAITVENEDIGEKLLLQEVQYLQQCVEHPIGLFVDYDLYNSLHHIIEDLEYYIWPIPSTRAFFFPKVAHLLYQMPWGDKVASVEILAESLDVYNDFMDAARHEKLCLMHFRSADNVYILFGNKMASNFRENGTIFAVPTARTDRSFISELPQNSYIMMESEIDLRVIDANSTQVTLDEILIDKTVLSSRVLALVGPLLDLAIWINDSLMKHCQKDHDTYVLETCSNFLALIEDWNTESHTYNTVDALEELKIRKLSHMMNFQMFQKSMNGGGLKLREIASQNLISNVTTYYHYNLANGTSHELKSKFGQVFNCQYVDSNNRRYPFLFDGESVMYWRIKPDAWIAAGMTAAILGVIVSLAILVFIVVRISLGDVFEGNPVTSILLLLSLILLFTSFVPFSMEYVSEHRNSHVTFDDASTLNTLCAVRVFIITITYCFTFSLLLCRALMLASIGSEGGFLSHVNGYIQGVICIFGTLVQVGMSTQLIIIMHIANESVSCENIYYGHWLWALLAYDFLLLLFVVGLVPFIYRSQRNYREGILVVIGAILIFIIWITWIIIAFFGDEMRDAALALGIQATGWAILVGILIPRTFLIVRGIERSDIAQALPSLTSLAFAQNNQYSSEQSVYECVNPAMRNCTSREDGMCDVAHMRQSPSEIPTLPLRGGGPRRQQIFANLRQANANIGPNRQPPRRPSRGSPTSSQSSLPPTPPANNKITRF